MIRINFLIRTLTLTVMMLLVGVFGLSGSGQGTTIYVDDDNTSGPWDGTSDHPYQYIQDGIDNANPKDTVFVCNGTYYENAVVDESIDLIGENRDSTVIDGGGTGGVISVSSDSFNVSGFKIRNSGSEYPNSGIYVDSSNYITIFDNIISNNGYYGILLYKSSYNTISGNIITENSTLGIYLQGAYWEHSYNNVVSSNNITKNSWGIDLDHSDYNEIFDNNIIDNEIGVWVNFCNGNNIYHNNFINNTSDGVNKGSNIWDDGYPFGGNYWDDYTGIDIYHGPDQDIPGGDAIGDTPILLGYQCQDTYPLMYPTWYDQFFVDDDQMPDWYDSNHVMTIQEGINSATDYSIIYVNEGTYYESVVVDKQVYLIGQIWPNVIVDGIGSGEVFSISADLVRISGFKVQNGGTGRGIAIRSDSNSIYGNILTETEVGMWLASSSDSSIMFYNNFLNNTQNAYDEGINIWDNGYPGGGNYWSDYTGSDNYLGPNQDAPISDGIGDIPYDIPGGSNQDNYPLMNPWDGTLPYQPPNCGDANNDGLVNIVDVVFIILYLFNNGPPPVPVSCIADVDGTGYPGIADVVYLLGYILKSATPPVDNCCW
ncbi:MAG: NosD domain-containing protein [Candidatus Zixiibacteriota bacterium]